MSDRDELRRLVEAAQAAKTGISHLRADDFLALLDAADRGDRAVELLRECYEEEFKGLGGPAGDMGRRIYAFLAEVDA